MQKLENLEITKVAFVPQGDNKKADVLLFKSKPESATPPIANEGGIEANVMKRVLLAIAKVLGFDVNESTETKKAAEPASADSGNDDPNADEGVAEKKKMDDKCHKETIKTQKGVDEDMKIDKNKLTPEEVAQYDAIVAKAGIQEDHTHATDLVDKNKTTEPAGNEPTDDDIYKGLHPVVAAELKKLRKRADEAEDRELQSVAKKYEILGKKPEELAKTLKTLKAAGGTAYEDMISVLDQSLAAVEKSGAFSEIGKSGSGTPDAWAQIEKHADEILKAAPTVTRAQAIDKACDQHPELVAEYEQNR